MWEDEGGIFNGARPLSMLLKIRSAGIDEGPSV